MIYRQKSKKASNRIKMAAKTKVNMKDRIRGFIFCSLWVLSIFAGFFLLICPILPLVVLSPKKYRKWSDIIFGIWEPFPVAMMEICFGIRVVLTGDKINPYEGSLFVMNHRTRVDWNFLWLGLFHCCQPNAHNMKYILKAPIMHFPGPGWVMQTCSFIFIHRKWEKDKILLENILDYLNESDQLYQVLLFPEGTDLTEESIKRSHKYADEHDLQRYYRVLHPRTTGFAFLASKMKSGGQLKAVYDVTVAYPKTIPLTEADLLRGKFPEEVHFHVKRYGSSSVPHREEDLRSWLTDIWQEKEEKLQRFYKVGQFEEEDSGWNTGNDGVVQRDSNDKVDYGSLSMKNGTIAHNFDKTPKNDQNPETEDRSLKNVTLLSDSQLGACSTSHQQEKHHMSSENLYRSKNYRPSHLLYLVLAFWLTLIVFTIHQLIYNFYVQIWILVHSILFTALSFVSNGFHQVAAAIYFYMYTRKPCVKKSE